MKRTTLSTVILMLAATSLQADDNAPRVEQVQFAPGANSAVIEGSLTGYESVDYRLRAAAGQRITAQMQGTNLANQFNVLPPGSSAAAMFVSGGDEAFNAILPDDGVYTLRVYLMRAAARREEKTDFSLQVQITGKPLKPLPAAEDALVAGTRYHAQSEIQCQPPYIEAQTCSAGVVRRSPPGTATVDIGWENDGRRRLLFIDGALESTDTSSAWTVNQGANGTYNVEFDDGARFSVPEALVNGG
ncbi:hypothetical protein ACQUQP_08555 [Marinobacterium sp. YM272]|uniref:hypothetical protein n=1 Tax=Marinobacterium sp. YM272 TaxID=3421654 RepID=UPI003D7FA047